MANGNKIQNERGVVEFLEQLTLDEPKYMKSSVIARGIDGVGPRIAGRVMGRIERGEVDVEGIEVEQWGQSDSRVWRITDPSYVEKRSEGRSQETKA